MTRLYYMQALFKCNEISSSKWGPEMNFEHGEYAHTIVKLRPQTHPSRILLLREQQKSQQLQASRGAVRLVQLCSALSVCFPVSAQGFTLHRDSQKHAQSDKPFTSTHELGIFSLLGKDQPSRRWACLQLGFRHTPLMHEKWPLPNAKIWLPVANSHRSF